MTAGCCAPRGMHAVCLDIRDLVGHVHFSSRPTSFTLTARMDKLQALWPRPRASFSSYKHKRASLPVAAWPMGLHGIAGVTVGEQHFVRLRTGAMQGLALDRPGASPLAHLSLMASPLTDPGFFAVRASVLAFRVNVNKDLVVPTTEAALNAVGRRHVGPVGVLLDRAAQISWTWDVERLTSCDVFGEVCLWAVSPQELDFCLAFGWQMSVAGQLAARQEFAGIQQADFGLTMQMLRDRPATEQSLMHMVLQSGTFFTADKLIV